MTDDQNKQTPPQPQAYPQALRARDRFQRWAVWIIPLLILGICAYLLEMHALSTGPEIRVAFEGAVPIEAEKTQMKYKGVEVGRVKSVSLSPDLRLVLVDIQLADFAQKFATQGAQFWVVRPEITASGVQGIETLASGSYIEAVPGRGSDKATIFKGLPEDPEHSRDVDALTLTLEADAITKLQPGSSVQYRGVDVGQVMSIDLDKRNDNVKITIYVRGPFRDLVNSSSEFTYNGGFSANFSLSEGAHFQLSSLPILLKGAITFTTPNKGAAPIDPHTLIHLKNATPPPDGKTAEAAAAQTASLKLTLVASKITKLQEGSQVEYRGLAVGKVDSITLDRAHDDVHVAVSINGPYRDLINQSTKFWYANGIKADFSLFSGAKLQLSSLPVLLNGAIDFITPVKDAPRLNTRVPQTLYDSYDEKWGKEPE